MLRFFAPLPKILHKIRRRMWGPALAKKRKNWYILGVNIHRQTCRKAGTQSDRGFRKGASRLQAAGPLDRCFSGLLCVGTAKAKENRL